MDQELDWKNSAEILLYHSNGCGDDCWAAQLKDRKTHRKKIELSCDGEKLYTMVGKNVDQIVYKDVCYTCPNFQCKADAIVADMEKIAAQKD